MRSSNSLLIDINTRLVHSSVPKTFNGSLKTKKVLDVATAWHSCCSQCMKASTARLRIIPTSLHESSMLWASSSVHGSACTSAVQLAPPWQLLHMSQMHLPWLGMRTRRQGCGRGRVHNVQTQIGLLHAVQAPTSPPPRCFPPSRLCTPANNVEQIHQIVHSKINHLVCTLELWRQKKVCMHNYTMAPKKKGSCGKAYCTKHLFISDDPSAAPTGAVLST